MRSVKWFAWACMLAMVVLVIYVLSWAPLLAISKATGLDIDAESPWIHPVGVLLDGTALRDPFLKWADLFGCYEEFWMLSETRAARKHVREIMNEVTRSEQ